MHGHAGMVVPPARYTVEYSITAYVMEPNPGEAPLYPPGVTAANQRIIDTQWRRSATIYAEQTAVHQALKNQLQRSIPDEFWAGLLVPGTGLATVNIQAMYQYLYANYGQVTDADLELNRQRITEQFDFSGQPMEMYYKKIYDAQQLATNAGRAYTDAEIVSMAFLNLERSGVYPLDCREWEMRPAADKTYINLRAHFIAAQVRQRHSRGLGNGMINNIETLEEAMRDFTKGAAADRAAAAELRQQNEALNASVNNLQQQMADMFSNQQAQLNAAFINAMQQQPFPPYQHQGNGNGKRKKKPKAQTPAFPTWMGMQQHIMPQALQQQFQQFQQQQQQQQQQRPVPFQQMPGQQSNQHGNPAWMPMQANPQFMPQYMQQPMQQKPTNQRPLRSKTAYCHTHGYDVADGHTSMTCRNPGPNHQYMATRENPMGGSTNGASRVNL